MCPSNFLDLAHLYDKYILSPKIWELDLAWIAGVIGKLSF